MDKSSGVIQVYILEMAGCKEQIEDDIFTHITIGERVGQST